MVYLGIQAMMQVEKGANPRTSLVMFPGRKRAMQRHGVGVAVIAGSVPTAWAGR